MIRAREHAPNRASDRTPERASHLEKVRYQTMLEQVLPFFVSVYTKLYVSLIGAVFLFIFLNVASSLR